jgi:hypothetical protein
MSAPDPAKLCAAPLVILCVFLLFAGSVAAQGKAPDNMPAQLQVKVLANTGEPLRGVTVNVSTQAGDSERSTNAAGLATFLDVPPGAATIQVVSSGWNSAGRNITLSPGQHVELSVPLEPHEAPEKASPKPPGVPSSAVRETPLPPPDR